MAWGRQNVTLARQFTQWELDVMTEDQAEAKAEHDAVISRRRF